MDDTIFMAQLKAAQIAENLELIAKEQEQAISDLKKSLQELSKLITQK